MKLLLVPPFWRCRAQKADYVLLEVGLGGRLDATNVIARPALTIITPVSLDHEQFLGNTIKQIAGEKAGIIKPFCPVVIGKQNKDALEVITEKAFEQKAPILAEGRAMAHQGSGQ